MTRSVQKGPGSADNPTGAGRFWGMIRKGAEAPQYDRQVVGLDLKAFLIGERAGGDGSATYIRLSDKFGRSVYELRGSDGSDEVFDMTQSERYGLGHALKFMAAGESVSGAIQKRISDRDAFQRTLGADDTDLRGVKIERIYRAVTSLQFAEIWEAACVACHMRLSPEERRVAYEMGWRTFPAAHLNSIVSGIKPIPRPSIIALMEGAVVKWIADYDLNKFMEEGEKAFADAVEMPNKVRETISNGRALAAEIGVKDFLP